MNKVGSYLYLVFLFISLNAFTQNGKWCFSNLCDSTIYTNNFSSAPGNEWTTTSGAPPFTGSSIGPLGADLLTFQQQDLVCHDSVRFTFTIRVSDSWDGNGNFCCGPDVYKFILDGATVFQTTFSNTGGAGNFQAFPNAFDPNNIINNTGYSGALAFDDSSNPRWATYRLHYTFAHTNNSLQFAIGQPASQGITDEGWELEDFTFKVVKKKRDFTTFSVSGNECTNDPILVSLTDPSEVVDVKWYFFDENLNIIQTSTNLSETVSFNNPGKVYIVPRINYPCDQDSSLIDSVTIIQSPTPFSLGNDTNICNPGSLTLIAPTTFSSYNWVTTETTPSITVTNSGEYWVDISNSNTTCKTRDTINVTFHDPPAANFSHTDSCGNLAYFTNTTQTNGTYTSIWNFGDGTTGNSTNPSHNYPSDGKYNVNLTVTDQWGCSANVVKKIFRFPYPSSDFITSDTCEQSQTTFTNSTTINSGSFQSSWTVQGNTSSTNDLSHSFSQTGTYPIQLITTSTNGCVHDTTKNINIHPKPSANFLIDTSCINIATLPQNLSTISNGTISQYIWNTGINQNYSGSSPSITFTDFQHYDIELITISDKNCSDTITKGYRPHETPVVNFTYSDSCEKTTINFINTSPGNLTTSIWNYGDGSPLEANTHGTHAYTASGQYPVQLIISSTNNCINDTQITLRILPLPNISFTQTTVCEQTIATSFTNTSSIQNGQIQHYLWDFGDGNTDTVSHPNHLYNQAGQYTAMLTAISTNGCADSLPHTVNVLKRPTADFTSDTSKGCPPLCVQYSNTSNSNASYITNNIWQITENYRTVSQNALFCYKNTSTDTTASYDIQLITFNDLGCSDTLIKNDFIHVFSAPIADFDATPEITKFYNSTIEFENTSFGNFNDFWFFGDGETSSEFSPKHTYLDTGIYHPKLIVHNDSGCVDSLNKTIIIEPDILLYIPNSFTPNNDGINDTFFYSGFGILHDDFHFYIHDRWGELIYYTQKQKPWDGTREGIPVKPDVYNYRLDFTDIFGTKQSKIGRVSLLK